MRIYYCIISWYTICTIIINIFLYIYIFLFYNCIIIYILILNRIYRNISRKITLFLNISENIIIYFELDLLGTLFFTIRINMAYMKLSVPLVSSIYAYAAFTVAAPKYRNSLPDELRTLSYFITFKCRLHSYMLSL